MEISVSTPMPDAAVSRALEIVIGEVVLRAGSDVEPDHLANVIRAVRKA